ncbi:hypothetical protein [Streptomyces sp. NPDC085540]|uniref:hypothetical protein n=1 Tax=Streptomyces sp. NPDC085540 TaxID=3365730 RepID=UPI0037D3B645
MLGLLQLRPAEEERVTAREPVEDAGEEVAAGEAGDDGEYGAGVPAGDGRGGAGAATSLTRRRPLRTPARTRPWLRC